MLPPSFRLLQEHNYAHYPGQASRHGDTSPGHSRVSYSGLIVQANTMGLITKIYLNQKTFVYKTFTIISSRERLCSCRTSRSQIHHFRTYFQQAHCVASARRAPRESVHEAVYLFPFFIEKTSLPCAVLFTAESFYPYCCRHGMYCTLYVSSPSADV